jgi:hypothetical protein
VRDGLADQFDGNAMACDQVCQCTVSLQLRVLRLGFLQDGDAIPIWQIDYWPGSVDSQCEKQTSRRSLHIRCQIIAMKNLFRVVEPRRNRRGNVRHRGFCRLVTSEIHQSSGI